MAEEKNVGREEFSEFQDEVRDSVELILDKLPDSKDEPITVEEAEAEPFEAQPMQPKFKAVVEKYFDIDDGFVVTENYPERNRVTVNVPRKFSNATESHWTLMKIDLRSSSPISDSGDQYYEEVDRFLKKVATQLRYDRNSATK